MDEKWKGTERSSKEHNHKPHGNKLKNETTAGEAMRKKLRYGKKDNRMTKEEAAKKKKLQSQGRKKAYTEVAVVSGVRHQVIRNEDDNVGTDALNKGAQISEQAIYKSRKNHYSNKFHGRKNKERVVEENVAKKASTESNSASKAAQKKRIKREYEAAAHKKQTADRASQVGNLSQKLVEKIGDLKGALVEFVKAHPMEIAIAVAILILLLVLISSLSSCSVMAGGVSNVTVATSYTSEDDQILAVDADYTQLEVNLQTTIDRIETAYPGYDEYQYSLANIGHNPYQLAALLTVLYEDYTESEVQSMLQTIYAAQYKLTTQRIVETRTRKETRTGYRTVLNPDGTMGIETYTYEVDVEYEYYILKTTLLNYTMDSVVRSRGLTADQMQRYELLLETYGNKPYLFGDDIYSIVEPGDYEDYEIPPEALTDQKFANMIREGEKYLGYPYVWGGSNPSTSFDCSGFVSYVINHCGNGWSMGRQTASGLLGHCTRVSASEAKPGDLIFFQGTYTTSGASHVGIYVGNGMMLHCGNPIQYASINTNYWRDHFYTFGRIN